MKTDDGGEVEALYSAIALRPDVCCGFEGSLLRTLTFLNFDTSHRYPLKPENFTMPAKRKSEEMDTTPTGSPTKRMRLTQKQKQALMDNLQLESEWDCGSI
jgi:hypothetical protein